MRGGGAAPSRGSWTAAVVLVSASFVTGYLLAFVLKDTIFSSSEGLLLSDPEPEAGARTKRPENGLAVHTVLTSSGDHYQNFQTRIMYASYKMVQKMPGGENMVAFTRILHRTVPDYLMDEVPTFHVWDVLKPQCDGWCDYPVANRPNAIMQFFRAAEKDPSMIKAPWVFMTECDYVWMQPVMSPGSAADKQVPGEQYYFDYIIPKHPDVAKWLKKLLNGAGKVDDVPPSGPAPTMLRLEEWQVIGADYERLSSEMEKDEEMKEKLGWVREMYAWDVACALHADIGISTRKPPTSPLMVQPPFDEALNNASLCHYTWGALYHEGKPSQGAKQVYRWEKRDFNDIKYAVKPERIPMPPDWREGLVLEFDAPLTLARHNLVVKYLTQLNAAIDTLDDLTEQADKVHNELIPEFIKQQSLQSSASTQWKADIRYIDWQTTGSTDISTQRRMQM